MLKQYQRRTILQYNVIPGVHISLREASFLEKTPFIFNRIHYTDLCWQFLNKKFKI